MGIKDQILGLNNGKLSELLLAHLIEDSDNPAELFTKQIASDRTLEPQPINLVKTPVLGLAFRYAPLALCKTLTETLTGLPNEVFVPLFSHKNHDDSNLFYLMHHAPASDRQNLIRKIKSLREDQLIDLLFGNPPNFENFLKLLNYEDEQALAALFEALGPIHESLLITLFSPKELLKLFHKKPPQALAMALVNLLKKFNKENLQQFMVETSLLSSVSTQFNLGDLYFKSGNALHLIFSHQSKKVIFQMLGILSKLSASEINKLLIQRNQQNKTPLELFFARPDLNPYSLIRKLHANQQLRGIFTDVSLLHHYSLMHIAVFENQHQAVASYLEQSDSQPEHCSYLKSDTMVSIANAKGFRQISLLFKGLPLFQMIKGRVPFVESTVLKLLKENPEILSAEWGRNRTLLHHAARAGKSELMAIFLAQGADLNRKDQQGKTAIDLALANNRLDVLLVFDQFLKQSQLIQASTLEAFAKALNKADYSETHYEILRNALEQNEFSIAEYCLQKKDSSLYFLHQIGELYGSRPHVYLEQAIKQFIKKNLEKLASDLKINERQAIQLQLLLFIFALPPKERTFLLSSISMTEKEKLELSLIFSKGLAKPAIYKRFNAEEHRQNYSYFQQLSPSSSEQFIDLANFHLQKSSLSDFPPQLLQEFAKIAQQSLVSFNKKRICPVLKVLAIGELLNQQPRDEAILSELWKQLEEMVSSEKLSLSDQTFQLLLNLASAEELKHFFRHLISKSDSLGLKLKKIFSQYQSTTPVLNNSLLFDLFLEFLSEKNSLLEFDNFQIISDFLALAKPKLAIQILEKLKENLAHFNNQKPREVDNFSSWICALKIKNKVAESIPFIDKIDNQSVAVRKFALQLKSKKYSAVCDNLNLLADKLEEISQFLFAVLIDKTKASKKEDINALLKHADRELSLAVAALKTNPELARSELTQLISSIDLITFKDKMKAVQSVLGSPKTKDLKLVTSNEKDDLQSQQPALILEKIQDRVIDGLLKNPESGPLLTQIFDWTFNLKAESNHSLLYLQMNELMSKTVPGDWRETEDRIANILRLRNELIALFTQLESLEEASLDKLLEFLYQVEENELNKAIEFSVLANDSELKELIEFVLHAKRNNLPELLKLSPPEIIETKEWIFQHLAFLRSYSNQVFSFWLLKIIAGYKTELEQTSAVLQPDKIAAYLNAFNTILMEQMAQPQAKAILSFLLNNSSMLKNRNGFLSQLFLALLNSLFENSTLTVVEETLQQIPQELIEQILNHCLSSLGSDNALHKKSCQSLLNTLSVHCEANRNCTELIKQCLGYQDLEFLESQELIEIAKQILNDGDKSLSSFTLNAIWIQRLLTEPRFIAALGKTSPPHAIEIIERLVNLLRCYSLALKQEEYNRLEFLLKGQLTFASHHRASMEKLQHDILSNPERIEYFANKRKALLQFRADDCIRALFNQLEDNCQEAKKSSPQVANKALEILYGYYNHQLMGLRSDWIFEISDSIVSSATEQQGDLANTKSCVASWLLENLPHRNFEQREVYRLQEVVLCNKDGETIGFINETNYAMTFVDDLPTPLINQPSYKPGTEVYDSKLRLIGKLTITGQIQYDNLFQNNTAANLIAKLSESELKKSPVALDLLFGKVILENSIDCLYEKSPRERHGWINQQLAGILAKSTKAIQKDSLVSLLKKLSPSEVFSLFPRIQLEHNAVEFLEAILTDPLKREDLFVNKSNQELVFTSFKGNAATVSFANFLAQHHLEPWFEQGLNFFSNFARQSNQPALLNSALKLLNEQAFTKKTLADDLYHSIISRLISSETSAILIWETFLQGSDQSCIQDLDPELAEVFCCFFYKIHCIPALKNLNNRRERSGQTYQERLLLLILKNRREQLFQANELRYADHIAWSTDELQQVSLFIKRQFHKHQNSDKDKAIINSILGELVFRSANYGMIDLFYRDNRFDPLIATQTLERSYLNALAAKQYLPAALREKMDHAFAQLKGWFDNSGQHQLMEELKANQAIMDWKTLADETWQQNESMTELPLITAYLINYSGPNAPLIKLVKEYLSHPGIQRNRSHLQAISQVMAKYSHRDFSLCIFTSLEQIVTQNPEMLDKTFFAHMVAFYGKKYPEKNIFNPEISLITHFGKQRKYELVQQACRFVESASVQRSLLKKIKLEAAVESGLSKHRSSWYFSLWQFFVRAWNYGFANEAKASQCVSFCDSQRSYQSPTAPKRIRSPALGGLEIQQNKIFVAKHRKIKSRLTTFLEKQTESSSRTESLANRAITKQNIFINPKPPLDSSRTAPDKTLTGTLVQCH